MLAVFWNHVLNNRVLNVDVRPRNCVTVTLQMQDIFAVVTRSPPYPRCFRLGELCLPNISLNLVINNAIYHFSFLAFNLRGRVPSEGKKFRQSPLKIWTPTSPTSLKTGPGRNGICFIPSQSSKKLGTLTSL